MDPLEHLVVGPDVHGVVRFGLALQRELAATGLPVALRRTVPVPAPGARLHVQFTDRLLGADAGRAAAAVTDLTARVHRGGGRITATLHDLPQPSDGAHHRARSAAYATVARELDAVVVSSDHERELLADTGFRGSPTVVPLPVETPATTPIDPCPATAPPKVAVFGFVYPGKGHAEVLDAMRGLPREVRMTAIGAPSAGHDDLVDALAAAARAQHRPFTLTGHVPDHALPLVLRAAGVPVAHHRHVSASGSLNSWLTAGRRPLAPSTRYTREIAARNPGALLLYEDDRGGLAMAIRAALADPVSTWLPPGYTPSPSPDEVARRYGRFLTDAHR